MFDEFYLQATSVSAALGAIGAEKIFQNIWYDNWKDIAAVRQKITASPAFDSLSPEYKDFLSRVQMEIQDDETLFRDMEQIVHLLGRERIVFVSHCDTSDASIKTTSDRRNLIRAIAANAAKLDVQFFDPSPHVAQFGRRQALLNNGFDTEHYTPEFEDWMARHFMRQYWGAEAPSPAQPDGQAPATSPGPARMEEPADMRLNAALVSLHRRRSADEGTDASGLYALYQTLVDMEQLVGRREWTVADFIENEMPAYDLYVVFRAGLGELALLIAMSGRRVIASEPHPLRRRAIGAGRIELERPDFAGLADACRGCHPAS